MSEIKKVVLAYSGGLDTSIIIPWLKEHYNNCEVIAVCGNVGQKGELEGLEERAKASGASKLYVEDLTDEFVEDYVIPTMQAGADYEGYLLGTSFARPILAKRVVEIARAEGADAVCHGSTGKGNDQVRFELAIMHFAPDLKIITPWREWDIQSRDEEIDYAEAHHIPLKINASGVLPLIFASAIMQFPATIFAFFPNSSINQWWNANVHAMSWGYQVIFALLIIAFTFFYSSISFDAKRQAEQLTMQGAVIPGQRGKNIRGFLQTTVNRLNLFSALFLAILAAVPTILTTQLNTAVPFAASSILIAVSVSLETIRAIRAEMSIRGIDSNLDTAGFM